MAIPIDFPEIFPIFISTKIIGPKWKNDKLSNLPIWTIVFNFSYVLFMRFSIHITYHSPYSYRSPCSRLLLPQYPPSDRSGQDRCGLHMCTLQICLLLDLGLCLLWDLNLSFTRCQLILFLMLLLMVPPAGNTLSSLGSCAGNLSFGGGL